MTHLYEVTEHETTRPRLIVVWTDGWDKGEFAGVCDLLSQQEFRILNVDDEFPADEITLRDWLPLLAHSTHIALPNTWWTSATAHQLVQVAGWIGVKFIDFEGLPIPTASLRGA